MTETSDMLKPISIPTDLATAAKILNERQDTITRLRRERRSEWNRAEDWRFVAIVVLIVNLLLTGALLVMLRTEGAIR